MWVIRNYHSTYILWRITKGCLWVKCILLTYIQMERLHCGCPIHWIWMRLFLCESWWRYCSDIILSRSKYINIWRCIVVLWRLNALWSLNGDHCLLIDWFLIWCINDVTGLILVQSKGQWRILTCIALWLFWKYCFSRSRKGWGHFIHHGDNYIQCYFFIVLLILEYRKYYSDIYFLIPNFSILW